MGYTKCLEVARCKLRLELIKRPSGLLIAGTRFAARASIYGFACLGAPPERLVVPRGTRGRGFDFRLRSDGKGVRKLSRAPCIGRTLNNPRVVGINPEPSSSVS